MIPIGNWVAFFSVFTMSFVRGVPGNIFFTYSLVYLLIPRFLEKRKYFLFILFVVVSVILLQVFLHIHFLFPINRVSMNAVGVPQAFVNLSLVRGIGNPPLIFGLFLSLKTLKNWHVEQLKTLSLAKENTNAELQLLKAQVHPHFLFNTLNNIYSFTLNQSPQAASLVKKLANLLHYMIHECDQPLVLLERELKLLRDYTGLEKVRYGDRLDIDIKVEGDVKNKLVAPLLMIPFLENCFKHGASMMRGRQWIKVKIRIEVDRLHLELSNTKPADTGLIQTKSGIGLANARKRLELLYPGKHSLDILSTEDVYVVKLELELVQLTESALTPLNNLQPAVA